MSTRRRSLILLPHRLSKLRHSGDGRGGRRACFPTVEAVEGACGSTRLVSRPWLGTLPWVRPLSMAKIAHFAPIPPQFVSFALSEQAKFYIKLKTKPPASI